MKNLMKISVLVCLLFTSVFGYSQRGGHHGGNGHAKVIKNGQHRHHKKVVIVRSKYRPAKVVVYHPHWCPKRVYNRRWVYFPRYNFYWDNWRNMYVYRNNNVWIVNQTPPPVIVNVNIENEKHYELKETEDDIDDVYSTNGSHQTEYKAE